MSRLKTLNKAHKIALVLAAVLLSATGVGDNLIELRARQLATSKNVGHLKLASLLQPFDDQIQLLLSDSYLEQGRPDLAIDALEQVSASQAGERLAQLQFELGRFEEARRSAGKLKSELAKRIGMMAGLESDGGEQVCQVEALSESTKLLSGLCWLGYDRKDRISQIMQRISSPEALRALDGASRDKTLLAQAFYVRGLLRSSQRALDAGGDPKNSLGHILSAKIARSNHPQDLKTAQDSLEKAILLDPGNLEAHQLLHDTYLLLGETKKASQEAHKVKLLQ